MNVVIPENLKAGDTFEVSVPVAIPTVAAIPAAPPPPRMTPGWFWFSCFWQALWALVRLLIANIVRSSVPFTRDVERDVNAVDARPPWRRRRRETPNAIAGGQVRPAPPVHRPAAHE